MDPIRRHNDQAAQAMQLQKILQVWRANRCLKESSINQYLSWIRRYRDDCQQRGVHAESALTLEHASLFASSYARRRKIKRERAFQGIRSALRTWAGALGTLGHEMAPWSPPPEPRKSNNRVLTTFAEHLERHRGLATRSISCQVGHVDAFLVFLRTRGRPLRRARLQDVDAFIHEQLGVYSAKTVSGICCSLRSFFRFRVAAGKSSIDLAPSIIGPIVRWGGPPKRPLDWSDVQRILRAIDRSTPRGRRDYALLLMMCAYGLGAGEIIHLTLDDIEWQDETLSVLRPKTGVTIHLPLLPAIARALVSYLRHGRPARTASRHVFVRLKAPHCRLAGAITIRHILHDHACAAGVSTDGLGTHSLRRTHACRQIDQGTSPKIVGDILGHQAPGSISAYVGVAMETLREMALPVPQ